MRGEVFLEAPFVRPAVAQFVHLMIVERLPVGFERIAQRGRTRCHHILQHLHQHQLKRCQMRHQILDRPVAYRPTGGALVGRNQIQRAHERKMAVHQNVGRVHGVTP